MKPKSFMLIAGEASGDLLAAELVAALRAKVVEAESGPTADVQPLQTALEPRFFGAGGPRMAAAGVELAFDLAQHAVVGISDVLKNYLKFRRLFNRLFKLALDRQPDVIIGVDYGAFNLRFGRAIKRFVRARRRLFNNWNPKLVQFVSPQVWASRARRANVLANNHDLLLSIFPFEKDWYAKRVPKLRVEFVGHPMVDRFAKAEGRRQKAEGLPLIVLLPGSRPDELRRHLSVLTGSLALLRQRGLSLNARMVLPDEPLAQQAKALGVPAHLEIRVGDLPNALAEADLAITKSGTITLECAFFGVPAVVFYKTSWPTYLIARMAANVEHIAMPNLLAGEEIFPEFIQRAATAENIANAARTLLLYSERRKQVKAKLAKVIASLGGPGASQRAAAAIVELLQNSVPLPS